MVIGKKSFNMYKNGYAGWLVPVPINSFISNYISHFHSMFFHETPTMTQEEDNQILLAHIGGWCEPTVQVMLSLSSVHIHANF
jgi:hypothetical protein